MAIGCADCKSTEREYWNSEIGCMRCGHFLCSRCVLELRRESKKNFWCGICNDPCSPFHVEFIRAGSRESLLVSQLLETQVQKEKVRRERAKWEAEIMQLQTQISCLQDQLSQMKRKETEHMLRYAFCSKCEQIVPHEQLFLCASNPAPMQADTKDITEIFAGCLCGACAMPQAIENAQSVKKALPVAVLIVSDHVSNDFVKEIDGIFGEEWGSMIEGVVNLKTDVQKRLSKEVMFDFIGKSKTVEEYYENVEKMRAVIDNLRSQSESLKQKIISHQAEVDKTLESLSDESANRTIKVEVNESTIDGPKLDELHFNNINTNRKRKLERGSIPAKSFKLSPRDYDHLEEECGPATKTAHDDDSSVHTEFSDSE